MKKIKLLVLAVLLTSVFSMGTYAQNNERGKEFNVGNTIIRPMRPYSRSDRKIAITTNTLGEKDGNLSINTSTYAHNVCDKLKVSIYLQKKINNYWSSIKTYTYSEYNSSILDVYYTYSNASSGSYRLKVYHYATLDGETDVETNYTSEIVVP
ncbi:MAG: hypothetical protein N4A50_15255 [Vallitalea sp.]|jgi:hypothetical protein|nr:hypothetical protein [Vallitalea sp.]